LETSSAPKCTSYFGNLDNQLKSQEVRPPLRADRSKNQIEMSGPLVLAPARCDQLRKAVLQRPLLTMVVREASGLRNCALVA
jgi:hypothetical protein